LWWKEKTNADEQIQVTEERRFKQRHHETRKLLAHIGDGMNKSSDSLGHAYGEIPRKLHHEFESISRGSETISNEVAKTLEKRAMLLRLESSIHKAGISPEPAIYGKYHLQ
jgi:hypothetical protein